MPLQAFVTRVSPSAVGAQPRTSTTLTPDRSDIGETTGVPSTLSLVIRPAGLLSLRIEFENSRNRPRSPLVWV